MSKIQLRQWLTNLILLTAGLGCAASPKLEDYPRREIDRPFTLPKGVATWSTFGEYHHAHWDDDTSSTSWLPALPLFWQTSLTDRWNLNWLGPIPVMATYQFHANESSVTGLILAYGMVWSSTGNSAIAPAVGYFHRAKLSPDFALELTPLVQPFIPIGHEAEWDLVSRFTAEALWQAAPQFALRAGISPTARRDARLVTRGSFDDDTFDISIERDWRVVLPLQGGFAWSFARQWDLRSTVIYQSIGEGDYSAVDVSYELRHFW